MTWQTMTIGVLVAALTGTGWLLKSAWEDLAEARSSVERLASENDIIQKQLAAYQAARKEQEKGHEEALRIQTKRTQLLQNLPSEWSSNLLPDDVIRVFKISPQDTVGPDRAATGADGADTSTGMDSAD